ncbi:MAG TPA: hypothetical protein DCS88_02735, partial [Alphaproteobacteria bacterium]|nr:hypothetical protein [Alphaproteobacteria bacterium]
GFVFEFKQKASFFAFEFALEFKQSQKQGQKLKHGNLFVSIQRQNQNPGGNPPDPFFLSIFFRGANKLSNVNTP